MGEEKGSLNEVCPEALAGSTSTHALSEEEAGGLMGVKGTWTARWRWWSR